MKNKNVLIGLSVFFGVKIAGARLTDGKVTHKVEKDRITISVDKGFHVNEKAPMSFKFYVCDDKNTTCEPHEIKPGAK